MKQRHGYLAGAAQGIGTQPGYRSDQAWAQFGIGNMEHWLESGRIVLYDAVRRLDEPFDSPQAFHSPDVAHHLSPETDERRGRAGSDEGVRRPRVCARKPLERIFRDMVGGNVMAWKTDELRISLGQGALGMPVTFVGPAGT